MGETAAEISLPLSGRKGACSMTAVRSMGGSAKRLQTRSERVGTGFGRQPAIHHALAALCGDGDARPLREPCTQCLGQGCAGVRQACSESVGKTILGAAVLQCNGLARMKRLQNIAALPAADDDSTAARHNAGCVLQLLPRVDQLWYKYIHMEEMLGNVAGARQIFERWMKWEPDHHGWTAYIKASDYALARVSCDKLAMCYGSTTDHVDRVMWLLLP